MPNEQNSKKLQRDPNAAIERYEEVNDRISTSDLIAGSVVDWEEVTSDGQDISLESYMLDIDRMVNEGLGGGEVTADNGFIGKSTTDAIVPEPHGEQHRSDADQE